MLNTRLVDIALARIYFNVNLEGKDEGVIEYECPRDLGISVEWNDGHARMHSLKYFSTNYTYIDELLGKVSERYKIEITYDKKEWEVVLTERRGGSVWDNYMVRNENLLKAVCLCSLKPHYVVMPDILTGW